MNGNPLQITQETNYLGVVIQSDLKFTNHIYAKISKAKRQLGMVKRTLFKASEKTKLLAYIGLCRPHAKYAAAAVWDPNLETLRWYNIMLLDLSPDLKAETVPITSALEGLNHRLNNIKTYLVLLSLWFKSRNSGCQTWGNCLNFWQMKKIPIH